MAKVSHVEKKASDLKFGDLTRLLRSLHWRIELSKSKLRCISHFCHHEVHVHRQCVLDNAPGMVYFRTQAPNAIYLVFQNVSDGALTQAPSTITKMHLHFAPAWQEDAPCGTYGWHTTWHHHQRQMNGFYLCKFLVPLTFCMITGRNDLFKHREKEQKTGTPRDLSQRGAHHTVVEREIQAGQAARSAPHRERWWKWRGKKGKTTKQ